MTFPLSNGNNILKRDGRLNHAIDPGEQTSRERKNSSTKPITRGRKLFSVLRNAGDEFTLNPEEYFI